MELDFEKIMRDQLAQIVSNEVDELIHEEVDRFYRRLYEKKDNYIAELMKSIRIFSEQQTIDHIPRYLITVENTYRIEK